MAWATARRALGRDRSGRAAPPGAPIEPFLTPAPPINVVGGLSYRF